MNNIQVKFSIIPLVDIAALQFDYGDQQLYPLDGPDQVLLSPDDVVAILGDALPNTIETYEGDMFSLEFAGSDKAWQAITDRIIPRVFQEDSDEYEEAIESFWREENPWKDKPYNNDEDDDDGVDWPCVT